VIPELHLPEQALALHLLFEGLQRLIDIVVANEYLHAISSCSNAETTYRRNPTLRCRATREPPHV
jgi:hypothetical protein